MEELNFEDSKIDEISTENLPEFLRGFVECTICILFPTFSIFFLLIKKIAGYSSLISKIPFFTSLNCLITFRLC